MIPLHRSGVDGGIQTLWEDVYLILTAAEMGSRMGPLTDRGSGEISAVT